MKKFSVEIKCNEQTYQSTVIWPGIMNRPVAHIQTMAITVVGEVYKPGQSADKVRTKSDTTAFPRSGSGL